MYVWHGRGSPTKERQAALDYAHRLSSDPDNIHGLVEGENDDDEMFWLILGSDEYARADYWRWRRESEFTNPRIWSVDTRGDQLVSTTIGGWGATNNHPVPASLVYSGGKVASRDHPPD